MRAIEQADAQAALLQSMEMSSDGLIVLDTDCRCLYANPAASVLLGVPYEDLPGESFLSLFPKKERGAVIETLTSAKHGDACGWSSIRRNTEGEEQAIEYDARPMVSSDRSLMSVSMHGITDTRRLVRTSAAVARIARSMTYAGTLETTLDALAQSVVEATGIQACTVFLLDENQRARAASVYGMPQDLIDRLQAIWQSGSGSPLSLQAVREGRTQVIPRVPQRLLTDPGFAPIYDYLRTAPWETIVSVPLLYGGCPLGILSGHYARDAYPRQSEITFLETIADQAAVAVENARLAAEAQEQAALEERRQGEEALRVSERQYRSVFEATTDAMFIVNRDGYIVETNPAACAMYGSTREHLIRRTTRALDPKAIETINSTGFFRARAINEREDGTAFHVEGHATRFTYNSEPHFLIVARDVTEQVLAYELLEQRVAERTRELSTLLDVSHNVTSTLELQPLLELILDLLQQVVPSDGAEILTLEGASLGSLVRRGPTSPDSYEPLDERDRAAILQPIIDQIERGEAVIIGDVRGDSALARTYRRYALGLLESQFSYVRSWVAVPMQLKQRIVGLLVFAHSEPDYYTSRHADLALAFAQQAAIAIENARLYEQAREMAAVEERQRLARELHDSVSQALYSIGLGARTARTMIERDPAQAIPPLDYVLALAQAGMAEMRALIFELRPESLENEGLAVALQKQAEAVSARHEIPVSMTLCGEPDVSLPVKEALYRIAQEALHNTVKHAQATTIALRLSCDDQGIALEIRDDGRGFDQAASFPGHLGLRSMPERAASAGGTVKIESAPGVGTTILARFPIPLRHPAAD
jgi:PAS domain S-box-containing protein